MFLTFPITEIPHFFASWFDATTGTTIHCSGFLYTPKTVWTMMVYTRMGRSCTFSIWIIWITWSHITTFGIIAEAAAFHSFWFFSGKVRVENICARNKKINYCLFFSEMYFCEKKSTNSSICCRKDGRGGFFLLEILQNLFIFFQTTQKKETEVMHSKMFSYLLFKMYEDLYKMCHWPLESSDMPSLCKVVYK